jgi:hypothetical protein
MQSSISNVDTPQNYEDISVQQEIPNIIDADADRECDLVYPSWLSVTGFVCTITQVGDNHLGYAGFRSYSDGLRNNGGMDVLVDTLSS